MSASSAVSAGRAAAEALMVDTIRLEHASGTTQDPGTLEEVPSYDTDYEGPGRVQRLNAQPGEPVVGGVEFGTSAAIVQVPMSVTTAARGQRVVVVASALDPALAGRTFAVVSVQTKSHATMRRLFCEEVT